MKTLWLVTGVCLAMTMAACSSGSDDDKAATTAPTRSAPAGFDPPAGVTLTKAGATLEKGAPGSVVLTVGDAATSAVTVTVGKVQTGKIADFALFSLDEQAKASTPVYVTATVKNDGPADLGGAGVPLYAHDSTNTNLPANQIVGTFRPCRPGALPKAFVAGATATVCLVYLLPQDRTLESLQLPTGTADDVLSWTP